MKNDYSLHMDAQELVQCCENCKHADCIGLCEEYKNTWRRLMGLKANARRGRNEVRPWDKIPAFGQTHTLSEWAKLYGISYYKLYKRVITNHWSMEKALTYQNGGKIE